MMKKLHLLFLTLFFISTAFAQQQHGSLSGVITATNGEPVAYVSVTLKGTSYGASTTDKGHFSINRIIPGTYTISVTAVNIISQEKEVTIAAGKNTIAIFVLNINYAQLEEVKVNARTNGIKMDNPSQSLRL